MTRLTVPTIPAGQRKHIAGMFHRQPKCLHPTLVGKAQWSILRWLYHDFAASPNSLARAEELNRDTLPQSISGISGEAVTYGLVFISGGVLPRLEGERLIDAHNKELRYVIQAAR